MIHANDPMKTSATDSPRTRCRPSCFRLAICVVSAVGATSCDRGTPVAQPPAAETITVPDPDTSAMESEVAEHISQARQEVLADPTSGERWGRLGMIFDAHRLRWDAIACYRKAHELSPDEFRWPYFLAQRTLLQSADLDEAIRLFEIAADVRPTHAPLHVRLGEAWVKRNRPNRAQKEFRRALELNPRLVRAYRGLGEVLLLQNEVNAAIENLERAAAIEPQNGAVFAMMARAYARAGNTKKAESAAEKSRTFKRDHTLPDPVMNEINALGKSSSVYSRRAAQLVEIGEYENAISELNRFLQRRPDDARGHARLGECYLALNRPEPAIFHLSRAVELKHDLWDSHVRLGRLFLQRRRCDEAVGHFRTVLVHAREDPQIHALLGGALAQCGDSKGAIEEFERAAALGPLRAAAHNNWGTTLRLQGRLVEAAQHYRQAIRLQPRHFRAMTNLGTVLERMGKTPEAIVQYRRAARIDPHGLAAQKLKSLAPPP